MPVQRVNNMLLQGSIISIRAGSCKKELKGKQDNLRKHYMTNALSKYIVDIGHNLLRVILVWDRTVCMYNVNVQLVYIYVFFFLLKKEDGVRTMFIIIFILILPCLY